MERRPTAPSSSGGRSRLYVVDIEGGAPRSISEEGVDLTLTATVHMGNLVTPDGQAVVAFGDDRTARIFHFDGSGARDIPGLLPGERPAGWSQDGRLYVFESGGMPAKVSLIDPGTGQRTPWRSLGPQGERAGLGGVTRFVATPDGTSYAYSFQQAFSDVFLVTGIK